MAVLSYKYHENNINCFKSEINIYIWKYYLLTINIRYCSMIHKGKVDA